jgi:hypothetical protein
VLGLDYYRLKKRAEAAASDLHASGPGFVELTSTVLVGKPGKPGPLLQALEGAGNETCATASK